MVLRGTQIHWRGQTRCRLVSAQSLLHDLAQLYGRARPLTSTDPGGGQTCTSMRYGPGPILMAGNRSLRLAQDVVLRACCATSRPMRKGHSLYPVMALIVLTLFTWIVAMWASCDDREEPHDDVEKPEQSSDEQDHRKAA